MEEELDQQPYGNPYGGDYYGSPDNYQAPASLDNYRRPSSYQGGEQLGAYSDPNMYTEDRHLKAGDYIGKPIDWSPSNVVKRVLTFGAVGNEDKEATKYNRALDRERLATQTVVERERAGRNNEINQAVEFLMGTDPNLSESAARQIANNHYASKLQADIATSGAPKTGAEAQSAGNLNAKIKAEVDRMDLADRQEAENRIKRQQQAIASGVNTESLIKQGARRDNNAALREAANENTALSTQGLIADDQKGAVEAKNTLGAILRAQEIARAQAGQRHFDAAGDADKAEAIKKLSEEAGLATAEAQRNAARLDLASPSKKLVVAPLGAETIDVRTGLPTSRNTRGLVALPGVDAYGMPTTHYGIGNTDNYLPPSGQPVGLPGATNSMGTIPLGPVGKTPSGRIIRVNP